MLALIQRVRRAEVVVDGQTVGAIGQGILALVAVEPGDQSSHCRRLAERLLGYRIFSDEQGRMNRSLRDVGGELLLVSQFTLAADTRSGTRPGFSTACPPELAKPIFDEFVAICRQMHGKKVDTGVFGADMAVSLVNDGPVTFLLRP